MNHPCLPTFSTHRILNMNMINVITHHCDFEHLPPAVWLSQSQVTILGTLGLVVHVGGASVLASVLSKKRKKKEEVKVMCKPTKTINKTIN